MANWRMYSKDMMESDDFLELSPMAQLLYLHLLVRADDDGFLSNTRSVMRLLQCGEEEMEALATAGYVLRFSNNIVAIRHWFVHNKIRADRRHETRFAAERRQVQLNENHVYEWAVDNTQPTDNQPSTEDKISKDKISEDKISEMKASESEEEATVSATTAELLRAIENAFPPVNDEVCREVMELYNRECPSLPRAKHTTDKRKAAIGKIITYAGQNGGFESIFRRVEDSDFLSGRTGTWRQCDLDWILEPENMDKILEGFYDFPRHGQTRAAPDDRSAWYRSCV